MAETRTSSRRLPLIAAALVFAVVCGYPLVSQLSKADAARAKVIGQTRTTPKPDCPGADCLVVGSVTGFQQRAHGERGLFKVRRTGHIVAWSVELGKPDAEGREGLTETFDGAPRGRLAVLRKEGRGRFKLTKQSPTVDLSSSYNSRSVITLNEPLRVRKGDVIGITVPTWLPNLVPASRAKRSLWKASRKEGRCSGRKNAINAKPQQKVDSVRQYGCSFSDRLLYWAYFVPS